MLVQITMVKQIKNEVDYCEKKRNEEFIDILRNKYKDNPKNTFDKLKKFVDSLDFNSEGVIQEIGLSNILMIVAIIIIILQV